MAYNRYTVNRGRSSGALQNNEQTTCSVNPSQTDTEVTKLHSVLNDLKNVDLDGILTLTTTLSRTQEQLDNIRLEMAKVRQEYDGLRDAYDSNLQQTQELQDKHEQLLTKAKQLIKEAKEKAATEADEKVQNLKRQLLEKEEEIRQITLDKDSALSRLHKETEGVLNHNHSDTASVGDPFRPSKVAEKYSDLYENDWTEALKELQTAGLDEKTGVRILLEIMQHIYSFCKNAKQKQIQGLTKLLDNPLSLDSKCDENPSIHRNEEHVKQMLESCGKTRTETIIQNLQKEYSKITNKPRYANRLPDYTNNCIEVCWLMNTHSPPLVFAEPVASGQSYDKDLYRKYTKEGDIVSFVVWLPMMIEGGVILSKGVVQPTTKMRPKQNISKYEKDKCKVNLNPRLTLTDTDRYCTSYTTEETIPATATGGQDSYTSKATYQQDIKNGTNVEPKEYEIFEHGGHTYGFINNQLCILDGSKWLLTSKFLS